jgi:hypothetical protein
MEMISTPALAALAGLAGGAVLGLAARRARFCTLGAIEGALYGADWSGVRMWGVALGVAIFGAFGLAAAGVFDPADTFYLRLEWNPAASVVGGLMFGYGMALAGNCGFGALARLGGGDLRAFVVVVVMGISAAMAIGGPTAELRQMLFPPLPADPDAPPQSLAYALAGLSGIAPAWIGAAIGAALVVAAMWAPDLRADRAKAGWAAAVGLAIASGWALTAPLAYASFEAIPVESHTYAAPLGDTILWTMTSSGGGLGFGVGSVFGVALGALIGSWRDGRFRWEACDDPAELARQIGGAFLMGTGGVIALGCSVGQGLTAFSLLSYGAPVTLAAIAVGAAIGLRQMIRGFHAL